MSSALGRSLRSHSLCRVRNARSELLKSWYETVGRNHLKSRRSYLLIVAIVAIGCASVAGQDSNGEDLARRDSLRLSKTLPQPIMDWLYSIPDGSGLEGVTCFTVDLSVDRPTSSDIDTSLLLSEIKSKIELKLRMSGIGVGDEITDCESPRTKLIAHLDFVPIADVGYAFGLQIAVEQLTLVTTDPLRWTYAFTWTSGRIGVCTKSRLRSFTKEAFDGLMDIFLNDYLKANPIDRR